MEIGLQPLVSHNYKCKIKDNNKTVKEKEQFVKVSENSPFEI